MGAVAVVLVTGLFLAADRLFPAPSRDTTGRRIDGIERRRGEIRAYLDRIGERYVEDATVHDHTVAFHLPDREVAITFDPQAYFHIDGTGTDAVLCEHEMPGAHLGRRLPFDAPTSHAGTDAGADIGDSSDGRASAAAAFSTLGLPPTADAAEVTAAYRRRVKDVHPDHGGDAEAFRRLREAYTTAKDHADAECGSSRR